MEDIEQLQRLRLRLHRLEPSQPIRDLRSALGFIRERRVVVSTGRSSLPMLAEAITGRPIRGSWMADRDVYRIYDLLKKVYQQRGVYVAPLILGKESVMHVSLGPAVARVAKDRKRRMAAQSALSVLARRLLDEVERTGRVRMDRWTASTRQGRKARLQLEREMLVVSRDLHTEGGYHTALVTPWSTSKIAGRFAAAGDRLGYVEAVDDLIMAAVRSAVIAPEREVRRWFAFGRERTEELVSRGDLLRFKSGRVNWITPRTGGRA